MSSCHLTKVASVSWRREVGWSCQGRATPTVFRRPFRTSPSPRPQPPGDSPKTQLPLLELGRSAPARCWAIYGLCTGVHEAGGHRGRKRGHGLCPQRAPPPGQGKRPRRRGWRAWGAWWTWRRGWRARGAWRPPPHRAVLPLRLDAARVVVLDAAARAPLQAPLPLHQLLDLLVPPDAGRELGPQVDQVDLWGEGVSSGPALALLSLP